MEEILITLVKQTKNEKMWQPIAKFWQFIMKCKYKKYIPAGIKRAIIELQITLGLLSLGFKKDRLNDESVINMIDMSIKKIDYIKQYLQDIKNYAMMETKNNEESEKNNDSN